MVLPVWLGALLTPLLIAAFALSSYVLVACLLRDGEPRTRLTAGAGLTFFAQGMAFYLLMALRLFSWHAGLALAIGLLTTCGVVLRRNARVGALLRVDLQAIASSVHELRRGPVAWLSLGLLLTILVMFARALIAPPMDWDSLMYQLVRPALWIQAHGPHSYLGPGWWDVLDSRAVLGNSWSAWHMLLPRSDLLVPLAWFEVWGLLVLGTYGFSRELGVSRLWAWLAALAIGVVPAARAHMFCAYVDNLVAALVMLAATLLVASDRRREPMTGALAVGVIATGMAVKKTAAPFLLVFCLIFAILVLVRHRSQWKRPALVAFALGFAVLGPSIAYLWVKHGSPIYPYPLKLGGRVIFGGASVADGVSSLGRSRPVLSKLRGAFLIGYDGQWFKHVNFGLLSAAVWLVAVGGWFRSRTARQSHTLDLLFVAAAAVVAGCIYSPTGTGLDVARYALGGAALLTGFASALPRARVVLVVAIAYGSMFLGWRSWSDKEFAAVGELALQMVVPLWLAGGVFIVVWLKARQHLRRAALASLLILWLGLSVSLEPVRREYRHLIYDAAGNGQSWTAFPLTGSAGHAARSAAVFYFLDVVDPSPKRVAVTVGMSPDRRGINWFVYPVMGQYFQNEITYVSPLRGGVVPGTVTMSPMIEKQLDFDGWLARLRQADVRYVVSLAPVSYELVWMYSHPKQFQRVSCGADPTSCVFRLLSP